MVDAWKVCSEDIDRLNATQLTSVMINLLRIEASSNNIPASCVTASIKINDSDGGEDASIEWTNGVESTNWFPKRLMLFQCKATSLSPKDAEKEITIYHENTVRLKPMVEDILDRGGSYILFINSTWNRKMCLSRILGFRNGIRKVGKAYVDTADIQIYDSTKIAAWVNENIPIVLEVSGYVRHYIHIGLKTWEQWSEYEDCKFNFETDDVINSYISQLRSHFCSEEKIARIIGLSGLGKTRLALEAFRDPALKQKIVYADAANNSIDLRSIISNLVTLKVHGIIVIDNCPIELHNFCSKEVRRSGSNLKILSLDYSMEMAQTSDPIISLKPASDEIIKKIIIQAFPQLLLNDVDRIVNFSQGFPQMAVLMANTRLNHGENIGSLQDDDLVRKLLWARGSEDEISLKVISSCALFKQLGFEEKVINERQFVANKLCNIDNDTFYKIAQKFITRGILDKRGRYVQVTPLPLAIRLAADWLKGCSPERAISLFTMEIPEGMIISLCDQLSKLDFLPEAKELVEKISGPSAPFGQAKVLMSEKGSRVFRSLVEVNPKATTIALKNVIMNQTIDELKRFYDGRRNIVWALEKLCFWEETFFNAAKILLHLAVAENEKWSNNATNQIMQLFHISLSGTQANPDIRFMLIDYCLNRHEIEFDHIAIKILGNVIEAQGFSRTSGAEIQGSRAPLDEWKPKTWGEIYKYWEKAIWYLVDIAKYNNEYAILVGKELAPRIQVLAKYDMIDLIDAIRSINHELQDYWPDAIAQVEKAMNFKSMLVSKTQETQLLEILEILKPKTFAYKLHQIVCVPSWHNFKELPAKTRSFVQENIDNLNLIYQNIDMLLSDEQRQGVVFGEEISKYINDKQMFIDLCLTTLANVNNPNPIILASFLAAIRDNNRELVENTLVTVSQNKKLSPLLASITAISIPDLEDIERVLSLVENGEIPVTALLRFVYLDSRTNISQIEYIDFCKRLVQLGIKEAIVTLDLLFVYSDGNIEKRAQCLPLLKLIVSLPTIIENLQENDTAFYNWQNIVLSITNDSLHDSLFAVTITKNIVDVYSCIRFSSIPDIIILPVVQSLLLKYRDEIWDIFGDSLLSEDSIYGFGLMTLFCENDNFGREPTSVMECLPNQFVLEWCMKNSERAPYVLCKTYPVIIQKDGNWIFHPIIKEIIDIYSDCNNVLNEISLNLMPKSWTGSLVPYYDARILAIHSLLMHPKESIRNWATELTENIRQQREIEEKRNEEWNIGIY